MCESKQANENCDHLKIDEYVVESKCFVINTYDSELYM